MKLYLFAVKEQKAEEKPKQQSTLALDPEFTDRSSMIGGLRCRYTFAKAHEILLFFWVTVALR